MTSISFNRGHLDLHDNDPWHAVNEPWYVNAFQPLHEKAFTTGTSISSNDALLTNIDF